MCVCIYIYRNISFRGAAEVKLSRISTWCLRLLCNRRSLPDPTAPAACSQDHLDFRGTLPIGCMTVWQDYEPDNPLRIPGYSIEGRPTFLLKHLWRILFNIQFLRALAFPSPSKTKNIYSSKVVFSFLDIVGLGDTVCFCASFGCHDALSRPVTKWEGIRSLP